MHILGYGIYQKITLNCGFVGNRDLDKKLRVAQPDHKSQE